MVGLLVRFLFSCFEESETHSLKDLLVYLQFFTILQVIFFKYIVKREEYHKETQVFS